MTDQAKLQKKLRFQSGQFAGTIHAPEIYTELIGEPEGVTFQEKLKPELDFLHVFITQRTELQELIPEALKLVRYDGLLWVSYPKGSSKVETDVNRDIIWEDLLQYGIRPVTQISMNEVWSAIRFRPAEAVGK
jgi:hypothetical protein